MSTSYPVSNIGDIFIGAGHPGPQNEALTSHRASGHYCISLLCRTDLGYDFLLEPLKMIVPHQAGKLPKL